MPAATKHELLSLIDRAIADGCDHRRACAYLQLGETRAWRWRERRATGTLKDRAPGGQPVHAITAQEQQLIVRVFEEHGLTDRSHRKLAHRGSYEGLVWVSESTFRRVLAAGRGGAGLDAFLTAVTQTRAEDIDRRCLVCRTPGHERLAHATGLCDSCLGQQASWTVCDRVRGGRRTPSAGAAPPDVRALRA